MHRIFSASGYYSESSKEVVEDMGEEEGEDESILSSIDGEINEIRYTIIIFTGSYYQEIEKVKGKESRIVEEDIADIQLVITVN